MTTKSDLDIKVSIKPVIEFFAAPLGLLIIIPISIPLVFYNAWALVVIWSWYLQDRLGFLSYKEALGINFVIAALHIRYVDWDKKSSFTASKIGAMLFMPVMLVLFARVVLWFI